MRIRGLLAAACVLAISVALVACAPGDSLVTEPSATAESPSPSSTPDPATEQEGDGHECTDPAGDGATNDLTGVVLVLDEQYLTATFDLAQPVPATDTAMLGLNVMTEASDGPNYEMHQLGVKWLDGQIIGFFDFNFDGSQQNLDYSGVTVSGNQVTARWPSSTIDALGGYWRWFAFATHEGTDTDACPGEPLSFETLTYQQ